MRCQMVQPLALAQFMLAQFGLRRHQCRGDASHFAPASIYGGGDLAVFHITAFGVENGHFRRSNQKGKSDLADFRALAMFSTAKASSCRRVT